MKNLTTLEVARRLEVGKSTVNLWCKQGRFPNAFTEHTPRGSIWWIPESDLENFKKPERGRPRKAATQDAIQKAGKKKGRKT